MNNFSIKSKGWQRLCLAFGHSLRGFCSAWRSEAAIRQETYVCLVLIPLSVFLPVSIVEHLLLILSLGLVLVVELLNSAIEAVVDRVGLEYHDLSKQAKDIGSAAVFAMLSLTTITWLVIIGKIFID